MIYRVAFYPYTNTWWPRWKILSVWMYGTRLDFRPVSPFGYGVAFARLLQEDH